MIIKTSEVTGIVLNWAVAKIEGRSCTNFYGHPVPEFIPRYSTDWELGGEIEWIPGRERPTIEGKS